VKSFSSSRSFGEIVVDFREIRGFLALTTTGSARMILVSAMVFLGLPFFLITSAEVIVLKKM
jgi:hypothetical protein